MWDSEENPHALVEHDAMISRIDSIKEKIKFEIGRGRSSKQAWLQWAFDLCRGPCGWFDTSSERLSTIELPIFFAKFSRLSYQFFLLAFIFLSFFWFSLSFVSFLLVYQPIFISFYFIGFVFKFFFRKLEYFLKYEHFIELVNIL